MEPDCWREPREGRGGDMVDGFFDAGSDDEDIVESGA